MVNNFYWQMFFTFGNDKNTSVAKSGAKNLQIKKN